MLVQSWRRVAADSLHRKTKKKHIKNYAFTRRVSKLKYANFTLTLRQPYAAAIAALRDGTITRNNSLKIKRWNVILEFPMVFCVMVTYLLPYINSSGMNFPYVVLSQTDRQTDRQTGRQAGRQADRQGSLGPRLHYMNCYCMNFKIITDALHYIIWYQSCFQMIVVMSSRWMVPTRKFPKGH